MLHVFFFFLLAIDKAKAEFFEDPKNSHQQMGLAFQLHPEKLDALFHRAALMALLKAKAEHTLRRLPRGERVLFVECLRENGAAATPGKYAKCLVKLFRVRDAAKVEKSERHVNCCPSLLESAMFFLSSQNPIEVTYLEEFLENILKLMPFWKGQKEVLLDFSLDKFESLAWMDLLLEMTGSGKQLQILADKLEPEMETLEQKILPALERIAAQERRLETFKFCMDQRQREEIQQKGFTFLEGWQQKILSDEPMERMDDITLENKIKQLARLADNPKILDSNSNAQNQQENTKIAFQSDVIVGGHTSGGGTVSEVGGEAPETEHGHFPRTVVLTPSAFVSRVDGVFVEGVYLSPHAFATEIISPEFFTVHVLSPAAFVAAILSPMAMTARILSPWAFRAEILSPEAFSAYILNPDVFMAEVLSPKAFEPRVLSPKTMFMQILTPMAASPRIASPESMGLVVLSPNFLSPRINSTESLIIEVLSPHILGGEHVEHEDDQELAGGTIHIVGSGAIRNHHGEHAEHDGHEHGKHEEGHGEQHQSHEQHGHEGNDSEQHQHHEEGHNEENNGK